MINLNMYDLIDKKKRGGKLTSEEIAFFIKGVCEESIPNYQVSALLMAILIKGMDADETYHLTMSMANSGDKADLCEIDGIKVDKHSTGGVGDSTTFVVAPIVACAGLKVAKMSGRGLGHTGGTIDKLESIPNFTVELSTDEFINNVNNIGIAVIGQSLNICPADKKLYALRDVTATVDSIPLIASSIMSKKLAGGAENIVLDVKCGSGAFMQDTKEAIKLAKAMVEIGKSAGRGVTAVITDMNEPLDDYIGNKLEILGAIKVLKGERNRLAKVSFKLAELIIESSLNIDSKKAKEMVEEIIDSGKAYNKFVEMISGQYGDVKYLETIDIIDLDTYEVKAEKSGYLTSIDNKSLGYMLVKLGGGRVTLEDKINHDVGLKVLKRIGDKVEKGDVLAEVYYKDDKSKNLYQEILDCYNITSHEPKKNKLIVEIIK